jgi:hypothetical protein
VLVNTVYPLSVKVTFGLGVAAGFCVGDGVTFGDWVDSVLEADASADVVAVSAFLRSSFVEHAKKTVREATTNRLARTFIAPPETRCAVFIRHIL